MDGWKNYEVTAIGAFGEFKEKVMAPNKTIARRIFKGEHNPYVEIVSIKTLQEEE